MWRNWYTHSTQNAARNHVGSSPTISTKGGFTRTREKHCYKRVLSNPKKEYKEIQIDFNKDDNIKILNYTDSGRVKTVRFGNTEISGTEVRSMFGLKSTNFSIKIDNDNVIFSVIGYGHGVGMSQTGADSLAKQGKNYVEILKHFYTGVEITTI